MRKIGLIFFSILLLLVSFKFVSSYNFVSAQTAELEAKQKEIDELAQKLTDSQKQEKTLSAQINNMNNQIKLTLLKISKTENQITLLSSQIAKLEVSLDSMAKLLTKRVAQTYKEGNVNNLSLFLSSNGFSDFVTRYKYLKVVQAHDKDLLLSTETTRTNFDDQKTEMEALKNKLQTQQQLLDKQKKDKETLLEVTKNDEKRYQGLLNQARQELQSLLTSKFAEKRSVKKGDIVGLMGSTGFSTGPHLHFGVYNLREEDSSKFDYVSNAENPFSFLQSKGVLFNATSCDDVPADQNKSVGGGSMNWPMKDPRITQCFGHTPWSFMYSNNFHEGVDMVDSADITVRAVDDGMAYFYRGASSFGNNVRIFHSSGKMTLYLHLQ